MYTPLYFNQAANAPYKPDAIPTSISINGIPIIGGRLNIYPK